VKDVEQKLRECQEGRIWDAENAGRLLGIIASLKTGSCWCQMGIGNPMVDSHSEACKAAAEAVGESHPNRAPEPDRPKWRAFRDAALRDPILHRFHHAYEVGAFTQQEAAIGAALTLSESLKELQRLEAERMAQRSELREKGHQP
jgi:hypothetical protein